MLVSNMPLLTIFWNPPKTALVPNRLVTIPVRATEVLQNPRCKPTPAPSVDTNQINQKKKVAPQDGVDGMHLLRL